MSLLAVLFDARVQEDGPLDLVAFDDIVVHWIADTVAEMNVRLKRCQDRMTVQALRRLTRVNCK